MLSTPARRSHAAPESLALRSLSRLPPSVLNRGQAAPWIECGRDVPPRRRTPLYYLWWIAQVRSLRAANTTLRTAEIELRLTNEGLQGELARWRSEFAATAPDAAAPMGPPAAAPPASGVPPAGSGGVAVADMLHAFKGMSHAEQQETLKVLHKHAAESLPI